MEEQARVWMEAVVQEPLDPVCVICYVEFNPLPLRALKYHRINHGDQIKGLS